MANTSYPTVSMPQMGYEEGIFFDNDPDFRKDVATRCKGFTVVKVNQTSRGKPFGLDIYSSDYKEFLDGLSKKGKDTASILKKILLREGSTVEHFDPKSGLQENHIKELHAWVKENKGKKCVAVFDFDRTLTVMEGGFFLGTSISDWKEKIKNTEKSVLVKIDGKSKPLLTARGVPLFNYQYRKNDGSIVHIPIQEGHDIRTHLKKFTAEGFAEYLAGGTKRLTMLQDMFEFLYENDVGCFVLTNNTACVTSRGLFEEIMKVYTHGKPIRILCGMEYGGQKSLALASNTEGHHRMLCGTRRVKRKTKQTRKQDSRS